MKKIKRVSIQNLAAELQALPDKLAIGTETGLNSQNVVEIAKMNCPVLTGTLRETIRYMKISPIHLVFLAGGVQYINPLTGHWVDYAKYVHDGTSKMPPRPFLLQAIIQERNRIKEEIRRNTMELI